MKFYVPNNLKEEILCALPNCATMAIGMMTLNLWIFNVLSIEK